MKSGIDLIVTAEEYQRDGCIRVEGLLKLAEVDEVKRALARYMQEVLPRIPASDRTLEADGKTVRNLWRLEAHDAFFMELAQRPAILQLVRQLLGGEPLLVAVETFNKPAKVGSGVPHHQDNAYFCKSPPDVLTVWIAIDAATAANGPIYYVKGSHLWGMQPHRPSGVKGNSMVMSHPPAADPARELCGTLEPGSALIHHCQTIHYSAPNMSDAARCGLLLVYRAAVAMDDAKLRDAYRAGAAGA
jgi:phytanoyl-CoA hydroxylase